MKSASIKVRVEKRHILDRDPYPSSRNCPIARAIQEQFHTKDVLVDFSYCYVNKQKYSVSTAAQNFIARRDFGDGKARPATFIFKKIETPK